MSAHRTPEEIRKHSVRLWGTQNPRFFEGTRVAKEAAALLNTSTPARQRRS